jgi:hypothetical protein
VADTRSVYSPCATSAPSTTGRQAAVALSHRANVHATSSAMPVVWKMPASANRAAAGTVSG